MQEVPRCIAESARRVRWNAAVLKNLFSHSFLLPWWIETSWPET